MTAAGVTSLGVATASLASGDQNIGKEYIYRKLIVKDQEIYQKIGELLWSIMPEDAIEIYFTGDIYPEHYSGGQNGY